MKKIWLLLKFFEHKRRKIWCVMRLCVIFTFLFSFSVSARVIAQQEKVNLDLQRATLQTLFQEIQRQTGLFFVYNEEQCQSFGDVTIRVKAETVENVLEQIFRSKDFIYQFEDKIIVVKAGKPGLPQVQTRKVEGQVTDRAGNPLPGVTIMIVGTSAGVTSDANGRYSLTCPETKDLTLQFTFVGMKTIRMTVGDKSVVNVILQEEVQEMDEVVVTGIYERNKESFTGSAATYSKKGFEDDWDAKYHSELEDTGPCNVDDRK